MRGPEDFLKKNKDEKFDFNEKKAIKRISDKIAEEGEIRKKMDRKYAFPKGKDAPLKMDYEKKQKGPASGEAANARKPKDDFHTTIEVRGPDARDKMGKISKEKKVYSEGTYDAKLDAKGVDAKTKKGKATVEERVYRTRE